MITKRSLQWIVCILLNMSMNMNAQANTDTSVSLDKQQQSVVVISALTATGDLEHLKVQLHNGLDAGLTVNEIKEVLVQLYAYCGFPRSLNGINTFMKVLEERRAKGINDKEGKEASAINDEHKYQTGKATLQMLTGKEEKTLSGANAFAPAIDTFLKEHLFADIFSRDVLSYQQRELVTVAALAAMTGVAPQLQSHLGIAINTGITPGQLKEMILLIAQHISKEQADIAGNILVKVINAK